jgi:hypothetical protein
MNENTKNATLNLEVEEIESRQRAGGTCTSSTTSKLCTCLCRFPTTSPICTLQK